MPGAAWERSDAAPRRLVGMPNHSIKSAHLERRRLACFKSACEAGFLNYIAMTMTAFMPR